MHTILDKRLVNIQGNGWEMYPVVSVHLDNHIDFKRKSIVAYKGSL